MDPNPKTVVVTGGSGFVGTYLQQELTNAWPGATVVSWDLPDVDITKPETFTDELKRLAPDWIVHLAAIASVPAAIKNPALAHEVNVEGTKELINAIQSVSQDTKMLFVSTADIYGKAAAAHGGAPIPELKFDDCQPQNPYAESKLEAERMVASMMKTDAIRVRPFPHIGPGQGLGFVTADFASQVAAIETGGIKPEIKVGNLDAQRDFTDVRDVVVAYRLLMERGELGGVYNIASGKPIAIKEILHGFLELTETDIEVVKDPDRMRPSDTPVLTGDASKIMKATGWQPSITLTQSLLDILDWWRKNPPTDS